MRLYHLEPTPPEGAGAASPPGTEKRRNAHGMPVGRVDVVARLSGPDDARSEALAALRGRSVRDPDAAADSELLVPDVVPDRAVEWAIRHLLDAEITSPDWLCAWIADELVALAHDYGAVLADPVTRRRCP